MGLSEAPALLLSPSRGLGGGIERVVDAVARSLPHGGERIDLATEKRMQGGAGPKALFAGRALRAAVAGSWSWVICLHAGLLPVAVAAGRAARTPVALMAYGTEVWAPMGPVERGLVKACGRQLAISTFTARWLRQRAGISGEGVRVLSLPIAPSLAAEAARDDARGPREPIILTVSRLTAEHRYKGYFAVADAWREVARERPGARWVVIGDGDDLPALRAHCREIGIAGSVEFVGRIGDEELAGWYRRARGLALPSTADVDSRPPIGEGFGLVYAEAGAFGVPSIAAESGGGALDYVKDGETGLTVASGDRAGLVRRLTALLDDDDLRGRLGDAARSRTMEVHLPEHFSPALAAALGR